MKLEEYLQKKAEDLNKTFNQRDSIFSPYMPPFMSAGLLSSYIAVEDMLGIDKGTKYIRKFPQSILPVNEHPLSNMARQLYNTSTGGMSIPVPVPKLEEGVKGVYDATKEGLGVLGEQIRKLLRK